MHAEIDRVFGMLSSEEVVERLEQADIANARLNSMEEFWRHPQLEARGRWRTVGSPAGELKMLKPPFNLDGMEPRLDPVPQLGQHTQPLLRELGYSEAEAQDLRRAGAV
jgi:crotonobetainyl-CoA:carnitine CoA-transferase CaiB-like acyl-CoA transferase